MGLARLRPAHRRFAPQVGALLFATLLLASGCGQQAKLPRLAPAAFYAEIAGEFRIPYEAEVLGKILRDGSLKSDQVHPNAQGYGLMAERVYDLLRKSGAL